MILKNLIHVAPNEQLPETLHVTQHPLSPSRYICLHCIQSRSNMVPCTINARGRKKLRVRGPLGMHHVLGRRRMEGDGVGNWAEQAKMPGVVEECWL